MKKNRLYTANRWNQPAFMSANRFDWGGLAKADKEANPWNYSQDYLYGKGPSIEDQYKSSTNWLGISKADNPFSKGNIAGGIGAMANTGIGRGIIGAVGGVASKAAYKGISGGLESGAGKAVGNITNTVGGAVSQVNPLLGSIIQLGGGIIGGGINALGGTSTDQRRKAANDAGTAQLNNFTSNASSFDEVHGPQAVANVQDAHKSGLLRKGWARKRNAADRADRADAVLFAQNSLLNNVNNLQQDQLNDALANYSAFGGPIETGDMGAIDYGFMTDYLTQKKRENDMKSKMSGIVPIPAFMPNSFAIGGDLQTNGGDFSDGLTIIGAGGSHETNPNEGIQIGKDNEGTPNLVEEGETIFNDYVFSNRILADEATKQMFRLPKKKDITFADISKKLEKGIAETPNDPISKSGFEKQMEMLEEQQERQKQEMEAERAKAAFEALSPEEQTALMQQRAEQEAMAQQQAMAEQQAAMQQPSQEEMLLAQQQMMADGSEPNLGQEPQMNCMGGKINRFDKGGVLKFLNSLGYKTVADAEKAGWKPSDFGEYKEWKDINSDSKLSDDFKWTDAFSKRLTSPIQKAMLSLGWNPTATLLGRKWYEGDNGNSVGWTESAEKNALNAAEFEDYANRYRNTLGWAVQNGRIKAPTGNGTVSMADITRAMREAPDWKATDNWLYSDIANQAAYLGMARGLNPDNDTKFINRWSPYGSFTQGEDGNWNYILRDNLTDAEKKAFTDQFRRARTDNKVGVMYNNFTDPGTVITRYVLDKNGNPILLTTDDLSDYEEIGNYSWGDEANNTNRNAVIYRQKGAYGPDNLYGAPWAPNATRSDTGDIATTPAGDAAGTTAGNDSKRNGKKEVAPTHRPEWLRYAGLFGPAAGLGLMAAEVGRPDTSQLDAAIGSAGDVTTARWKPIGNYLTYRPLDIWYQQNALNAQSRATDRALMNTSGGNRGTAMAGLLANGYNSQLASGNLFRQAQEYNDNLRKQVEDFNRGTNQFNAEAYNRTSQFNADAYNRARQANAQMRLQAAAQKMDADAGWYNSLYGNISGLFKGLGDIGTENYRMNRIAEMAARGDLGSATDETYGFEPYLKKGEKKAKGGKINKKRGLTI